MRRSVPCCLLALGFGLAFGCQNPLARKASFGEKSSLETSLSVSSDDPAGGGIRSGSLPSLASEMADHRRQLERDSSPALPGGSSLTISRLLERGHEADARGQSQVAKMHYQQVLSEQADHPEANHRLAILADREGNYSVAEQHYLQALEGKPHDADVLSDLGYSHFLQGRQAESERHLQLALLADPRHPHARENLSLLSDPAKAEQALLSVMGPRETRATLARLFPHQSEQVASPTRFSQTQAPPIAQNRPPMDQANDPHRLHDLQQQMEEARLRGLTERRQQHAGNPPPALPPIPIATAPPTYVPPPVLAPQRGELPDNRINAAFRQIDRSSPPAIYPARQAANGSSQVPYQEAVRPHPVMHAVVPSADSLNARAPAPQWNVAPAQQWPQAAPNLAPPNNGIEQTHYQQQAPAYSREADQPPMPSAAQRAAEIGMATGPGAMFPSIEDSAFSSPAPAMRSLPGTNSRLNGASYQPPGGPGTPANYHSSPQTNPAPNAYGQPATSPTMGYHQPHAGFVSSSMPNDPSSGGALGSWSTEITPDPYAQQRALHNAQLNADQQQLSAAPELMSQGFPQRPPLPTNFNPNQRDWPAYTREEYDRGQREMEPAPPTGTPGQSTPPNYGHRW